MTDGRSPKSNQAADDVVGPGEELVAEDDRIIGRAFRWSLCVFVVLAAGIGITVWVVNRPRAVEPIKPVAVTPPKSLGGADIKPPAVPFADITVPAGVDFIRENGAEGEKLLPETMGGGVAFLDIDNDGDQDLLLVNSTFWPQSKNESKEPTHALYRNDGKGEFTNITDDSGLDVSFYGMGVAAGDYDNDGDSDVYITAVGRNHLFANDGSGAFEDVTDASGTGGEDSSWSTSAGFFDYDNDGDLDLFVSNYVKWSRDIDFAVDYTLSGIGRAYGPPTNFQGANNQLYRNSGDGTFENVTKSAGVEVLNPATGVPAGKALGVAFVDVDRDGHMDIIVANDTVAKFFYHNNGDGTFTERASDCGLAFDRNGMATGAMGIDTATFRNDDDLGVGIGNFANEMTSLYVSQGTPMQFADEAITEGIGAPSRLMRTFGLFFFDADLDGRLDMLQTNGHLEDEINVVQSSQHYEQPAQLFWNAGPQHKSCFVEIPSTNVAQLALPIVGRGAAYADIDGDGDLDVMLTQPRGRPMLLRNEQNLKNHWLRIKLVGNGSSVNRDAVGAVVEVTAEGVTQRRQISPTKSYLSQVELPVTFGLGSSGKAEEVKVTWPDGSILSLRDVGVDRLVEITQGN
jgi:hypothetical protein